MSSEQWFLLQIARYGTPTFPLVGMPGANASALWIWVNIGIALWWWILNARGTSIDLNDPVSFNKLYKE